VHEPRPRHHLARPVHPFRGLSRVEAGESGGAARGVRPGPERGEHGVHEAGRRREADVRRLPAPVARLRRPRPDEPGAGGLGDPFPGGGEDVPDLEQPHVAHAAAQVLVGGAQEAGEKGAPQHPLGLAHGVLETQRGRRLAPGSRGVVFPKTMA
jgi:hypothetical protein